MRAGVLVLSGMLVLPISAVGAQGVTAAAIRGTVRSEAHPVESARVRVVNTATGFALETSARRGSFLFHGLEPGGPYTVSVTSLGFVPVRRDSVFVRLGEVLDLRFVLEPVVATLDTVAVVAPSDEPGAARTHGGTSMTIPAEMVEKLPTLNRDLYDFIRLVPQISTQTSLANPAFSAVGTGFRFNNFLINGVSERTLSGGVSNAFAGLRSVPLEAVREYQALISPYDVRYGDFAGALVNTITRSGTNAVNGSAFTYFRSDGLARESGSSTATRYEQGQYGFSLGGPIVRDRFHFFIAPELQRLTSPAPGPYVGQPPGAERPVPVSDADLARLDAIMTAFGLSAGTGGPVENAVRRSNVFSRLDLALPRWNSRAVLWNNYSAGEDVSFSRSDPRTFPLSSTRETSLPITRITAVQLHTALPRAGGGHNELLVSSRADRLRGAGAVLQPTVLVTVPATTGGGVTLSTGTPGNAQGSGIRGYSVALRDNLTLPLGTAHVLTVGAEVERFRLRRSRVGSTFGTWTFASLDDLERGAADRYEVNVDFGSGTTPLDGRQYAWYLTDQWQAGARLSITAGLRADRLVIDGRAPYQPAVDSIFTRRTDQMPRSRIELSPRAGFVWDVGGTGRHHLRGGAGIFTGRFPLAWADVALSRYGVSGGTLRCGRLPGDLGLPPPFTPDYRAAPTACANGATLAANPRGDVNLLDPNLRMTRALRGSLAYDRRLTDAMVITTEAVFNRMLSDFLFVNLNLNDPVSADRDGRVMYGSLPASGVAITPRPSGFTEVIDVRNTSRNRSYQLATRLENEFGSRFSGMLSYTYSRSRDVQTPLRVNTAGRVAWASARVVSGRHDDLSPGISANDIPHRIVVAGIYRVPRLGPTELSFYWVGESGRPFTYIASGVLGRGDLNADGASNDPIYVPLSAFDSNEILFSGASGGVGADTSAAAQAERVRVQQDAFERLISRTDCLRRQRGEILRRNGCREPWLNTTVASLRHTIPVAGRSLEAQVDVFNVLNLLNSRWGLRREAVTGLLEHVGQTTDPAGVSQSVFHFDATRGQWTTLPEVSAFQLQLAARYRF
ncbi:MAG TPA: carboxypeptidase regulatory-like domain-containing protein [Gemmatimonadaceae bacterium]